MDVVYRDFKQFFDNQMDEERGANMVDMLIEKKELGHYL